MPTRDPSRSRRDAAQVAAALPLLSQTPRSWARLAAENLPTFLADHAVCERQAALTALNLVAHYPEDEELVERMTALAAEEVVHLRRVAALLRAREVRPLRRRGNAYVHALRARAGSASEPRRKIDRLLVGALIEARSCERFTCLLLEIEGRDAQVATLLRELGPAERRHWEMFHRLAAREAEPAWFAAHWRGWLEHEDRVVRRGATAPTVHG